MFAGGDKTMFLAKRIEIITRSIAFSPPISCSECRVCVRVCAFKQASPLPRYATTALNIILSAVVHLADGSTLQAGRCGSMALPFPTFLRTTTLRMQGRGTTSMSSSESFKDQVHTYSLLFITIGLVGSGVGNGGVV